jgi:serine/threonine protein kinase
MSVRSSTATDGTGQRPLVDPALPQVFGRYLLVQRLSRGGMGEIFLAKHGLPGFEKLAVIKKVLPNFAEDKQFISRFVDEAQVAIKLQHVNIAQVFEVGRVGDEYFLALEHVEGRDLRRTLTKLEKQGRRIPVDLALFVGRELANGLSYAHRRADAAGKSIGLVHCDISPPNVLVSFEGETKIIDFGIARSALRATASDPKMGFGKFGYMAPEQLIRGGVVDHRTDIYAAGVVTYELLTGQRLYDATNPDYRALARMVAKGEHKLPSHVDPRLAPYDTLITRALRPKQDDRYQSAAELRDAIQHALVALNPTISTDQLGSFLRDVFTDEMATQREINARIAATHIADYQDQMHTQAIETISFALSSGAPLADDGAPVPAVGSGTRARRPSQAGTRMPSAPSIAPTAAPSLGEGTGATELSDVDLEPMTGTLAPTNVAETQPAPGRRLPIWVLSAGALVAGLGVAFALSRDDAPAPPPPPAPAPAPAPAVDPGATVTPDEPPEIQIAPQVVGDPDHDKKDRDRDKRDRDRDKKDRDRDKKEPDPAEPSVVDQAKAVRAKAASVSREYREFKQKFGGRVDDDWASVAADLQYAKTPEQWKDVDRKLDRLRAKMRDQ